MTFSRLIKIVCVSIFFLFGIYANATVTLPAIFSDHMVLQQNSVIKIWGWGKPLEKVILINSWNGESIETVTNNHAIWELELGTPAAGGPYTLTFQGYNTLVIEDILIGEVWLASGQSNMEWSVKSGIDNALEATLEADNPGIRLFQVIYQTADVPQNNVKGSWERCTSETMFDFSAIAYFFGQKLNKELKIPIGLINSSWGGTRAETWMNPKIISNNKEFSEAIASFKEEPWAPKEPGSVYHAMIAPLIPFQIAGTIWYQGETNTGDAEMYRRLFPALIQNWRSEWQNEFPFYYVQIAPWKYGTEHAGTLLRESQLKTLSLPKTGMVVISDIGNIEDIHPRNKQDVGKRLANVALAQTYGKEGVVYSGPLYREMEIEEDQIRLYFDHIAEGLICRGDSLTHFQLAGEDRKFTEAYAFIEGETVVVRSSDVKCPVAVRFGWKNIAEPNLFNSAGLPASCFRTDDWVIKIK